MSKDDQELESTQGVNLDAVDRAAPAEAPRIEDASELSPYDELVARLMSGPLDVTRFADAVERQEAADAADTLEDLEGDEAAEVLVKMEAQAAADALAEMERPLAARVIEDLVDEENIAYASRLLGLMADDDAVDLLQEIDDKHREALLNRLPYAQVIKLRQLLGYDSESAGGIMTTDYVALRSDMTVGQAIELVRGTSIPEDLHHLLVTRPDGTLMGLLGLRDLIVHSPEERISDLVDESVDAINVNMDREAVADAFDRYDYAILPVVDSAGRLMGVITFDDVFDILQQEQTEDVQKVVGAGAEEAVYSTLSEKIKSRFPWLLVNLFTSTVAAIVVLQFDELISELAILAVLMPVIANQAGNAGQQSLAVTLRGIVLDQVRTRRVWPLLVREAAVGAFNGLVGGVLVGLGLGLFSTLVKGASWQLGLVAAIAMAVSLALGCFVGSSMPILMRRLGFDPATGSTIFLTMTTDTISFFTFLSLAQLLSGWLL